VSLLSQRPRPWTETRGFPRVAISDAYPRVIPVIFEVRVIVRGSLPAAAGAMKPGFEYVRTHWKPGITACGSRAGTAAARREGQSWIAASMTRRSVRSAFSHLGSFAFPRVQIRSRGRRLPVLLPERSLSSPNGVDMAYGVDSVPPGAPDPPKKPDPPRSPGQLPAAGAGAASPGGLFR